MRTPSTEKKFAEVYAPDSAGGASIDSDAERHARTRGGQLGEDRLPLAVVTIVRIRECAEDGGTSEGILATFTGLCAADLDQLPGDRRYPVEGGGDRRRSSQR